MKIRIETDYIWDDLSDKQREQLVIELIMTAPDAQEFQVRITKKINKLKERLD